EAPAPSKSPSYLPVIDAVACRGGDDVCATGCIAADALPPCEAASAWGGEGACAVGCEQFAAKPANTPNKSAAPILFMLTPKCSGANYIPKLAGGNSTFNARLGATGDLAPLQEAASFEDRRHRLFDPRNPGLRLLRAGEMIEISSLPA